MTRPFAAATVVGAMTAALAGCEAVSHDHTPSTRPAVATDVDAHRADPSYWLEQEPTLSVSDPDFERLWASAERVSNDYLFTVDRRDKRIGLMTTVPNISPQWFEPWRRELQSADDVANSSVTTLRRSIIWQFTHAGDAYDVVPKVLIEREVLTEERISGVLNRGYFRRLPTDNIYGSRETDQNILLPDSYWYPTGRDFEFEQRLIQKMHARLAQIASR